MKYNLFICELWLAHLILKGEWYVDIIPAEIEVFFLIPRYLKRIFEIFQLQYSQLTTIILYRV